MKKLFLITLFLFGAFAHAQEKEPTYPLTFTLPTPLDFPVNVTTDLTVKIKNTSTAKVGYGIRIALVANETVLKVIDAEKMIPSFEAGEEKSMTFKVRAFGQKESISAVPLALGAYLADGTTVGLLQQTPISNIVKYYEFLFYKTDSFTSTDKQIEFFELDITNNFHAYLYTGLQLALEFTSKEDGYKYEILGPSTIYLAPLAKKHTKAVPLAIRTNHRFDGTKLTGILKIKLYENGVLVSDEQQTTL